MRQSARTPVFETHGLRRGGYIVRREATTLAHTAAHVRFESLRPGEIVLSFRLFFPPVTPLGTH